MKQSQRMQLLIALLTYELSLSIMSLSSFLLAVSTMSMCQNYKISKLSFNLFDLLFKWKLDVFWISLGFLLSLLLTTWNKNTANTTIRNDSSLCFHLLEYVWYAMLFIGKFFMSDCSHQKRFRFKILCYDIE